MEVAQLARREGATPRRSSQVLLQRHAHRYQTLSYAFSVEDVDFLTSAAAVDVLAEVETYQWSSRTLISDTARARVRFGVCSVPVVETVLLRRRAAAKIPGAHRWLFTDDALQQATARPVAAHRAFRLAGRRVHDVTCSIGTELDALRGSAAQVVGSDFDDVRLAMARHNVPDAPVIRADALTPTTRGTVVIADPGRRSGGRRRHDPASLEPPLPDLLAAYAGRELVVKCAPGLDFDALGWDGEVEVVSFAGGVKEACLWSAGLSDKQIRRRASVLAADGSAWEITDAESDDIPQLDPGRYILDPDGAVVRAGLVRQFAARHGLWQLDPRIAYVTGDELPSGVDGFEILARTPLSDKQLRKELLARDCGTAEILVRGVDVDPDALRSRMKLRGSASLALVITRIGRTAVVFVCGPRTRG